ncbi:ABC transporter permease subunit [Hartmannibacter diazotrophicus]|uniref:branched-chain amino acid ABC transporter ATP-binding protein/permease n=1 Tax=Hartmannibacter diazotrophicus TaxID=1482074 RepID=UPI000C15ECF5|nr:ATP-binding cassette domain-containing protein [Hartmannibacter diazotrophicus]
MTGGASLSRFRPLAAPLAAAVFAAILVAVGPYLLGHYAINILIRAFFYAVVALTLDILWGYAGILTFGQAAFFGIGAYAAALIFTHLGFTTETIALAFLLAIVVPMICGLLVGWLSFYTGASPLYASVVSLAFPIVISQLIYSGGTFTGSSSGLVGYETFDIRTKTWFWIAGGGLVLAGTLLAVLMRSELGRLIVAVRDNETRLAYLGIDPNKVKIALTAGLAGIAGLAGLGYASFSGVVAPEITGFVFGTQLIIYVALGGRGTLIGPIVGTLGIELMSAYLSGDLPYVWQLIVGLVFVVVIIVMPKGLAPLLAGAVGRLLPLPRLASTARIVPATDPVATDKASIDIRDVTKSFGSLKVLQGIDLSIAGGELVSLVGPNGAGKTTLMRCLGDGAERSGGSVTIDGHDIGARPPHSIVGFGLGRKFQMATIFESLTVGESLRVARARIDGLSPVLPISDIALPATALAVMEATGLGDHLDREVRHLSHGQKQALELTMVLAMSPRVILLDEPTAGLTKVDRQRIGGALASLARDHGLAVILVEHDLDFVRTISSRVVVLHQGRILLDGTVDEVVHSELVKSVYSGAGHD